MSTFSVIVIFLLGFIAYQVYTRKPEEEASPKSNIRGTFSGAFSEAEIEAQQKRDAELQRQVEISWERMTKLEKKEIQEHAKGGGTKDNFSPSHQLKASITSFDFALDNRAGNEGYASRMIEANAAVLNGKPIKEAQEEVWKHRPQLRVFDAALAKNGSGHYKAMEERKDYWMNHWDRIVSES